MAGFEFRKGAARDIQPCKLDSTSAAIVVGDMITVADATTGFFKEVDTAAEAVYGVATTASASPSADGGATVMVDVSPNSTYECSPDAGTVTEALVGKSMDCGADAKTADINGSTTDDLVCRQVDIPNNRLWVQLKPTFTGV